MPELGYWGIRGLAQPIRLLLHYVGEEFEDTHYPQGSAPDFDRSSWFNVKLTKGLDFPNLPYYLDGENKMTQSNTILRYIGRKHNLLGSTDKEQLRVDLMLDQTSDFRMGLVRLCYNRDFEKLKPGYLADLPAKLQAFETFIGEGDWFAGPSVTIGDFHIYEMLDQHLFLDANILKEFPKLKAFHAKFEALPAIKEYMASDKFMRIPLNSPTAGFVGS